MSSGVLAVLLVGGVLAPSRTVPLLVDFEHREVGHEAVRGGAVPVLFIGLEEDAIAGTDDLDRPATMLAPANTLGDVDGLPVGVGMRVPGLELVIGGRPWTFPNGKVPQVHVDGTAIDPQRKHVYD